MVMSSESIPVLGYWGYRGVSIIGRRWYKMYYTMEDDSYCIIGSLIFFRQFGQQIRLLLEHTGTKYEDRKFSGDDWFQIKYKMGFDFPNLPFYIDGENWEATARLVYFQRLSLLLEHVKICKRTEHIKVVNTNTIMHFQAMSNWLNPSPLCDISAESAATPVYSVNRTSSGGGSTSCRSNATTSEWYFVNLSATIRIL